MKPLLASELMNPVSAVPAAQTVADLATFLDDEDIHGAPVVDADGILVGVVSRSDIARALGDEFVHPSVPDTASWDPGDSTDDEALDLRVRDIMTADPITASEDATAADLAQLMLAEGIHRVVICVEGLVRGIVTSTDLLGAVVTYEHERCSRTVSGG